MEGFTYNGIDSKTLKCFYIPDASDRWFESPDFEVYDSEVVGRPGGYFYGTRTKVRVLNLKVFFEDITTIEREKIRQWLKQGTIGEQMFDDRPFEVFRMVTPSKVVSGKSYPSKSNDSIQILFSGTFTVTFSAYDPYGYLTYTTFEGVDTLGASKYCGMQKNIYLPAAPTTSSRNFLMYNCGNFLCNTLIRIGGAVGGNGLVITNETNGSKCKLSSLPTQGYLEIDSYYGTVSHVLNGTKTLDYQYHDEGFLSLDPCGTVMRDVGLYLTQNSKTIVATSEELPDSCIGRYVWVQNAWHKITGRGADIYTVTVEDNMIVTGNYNGIIATLNKITVTGSYINLNTFSIDSSPVIE